MSEKTPSERVLAVQPIGGPVGQIFLLRPRYPNLVGSKIEDVCPMTPPRKQ